MVFRTGLHLLGHATSRLRSALARLPNNERLLFEMSYF
jgi:hypothetical protein